MKIGVAIDMDGAIHQVGFLYHEARGARETSLFEYLPQWRARGGFPLAPTMPIDVPLPTSKSAGAAHDSSLPGPLADAAPDDWGKRLIRAQRRARDLDAPTDLDFLLSVSDECRWGALHFLDAEGRSLASADSAIKLLDLDRLAADVAWFERTGELPQGLARNIAAASSPGGARPKAIVRDGSKLHIAKFTSASDQNKAVERAEVLALRLARLAGIDAPAARVVGAREVPIALIERFDRAHAQRLHVISAQSFLGVPAADGNDYADLVEQMRIHAGDFAEQSRQLYLRIALNVLIHSTDDHLKNHAFVHIGGGRWHLAPAFDLNPQPERHPQLKTGINGRFDATVDNLLSGHAAFGMELKTARELVGQVWRAVEKNWRSVAKEVGMGKADIQRYAPAFVQPPPSG